MISRHFVGSLAIVAALQMACSVTAQDENGTSGNEAKQSSRDVPKNGTAKGKTAKSKAAKGNTAKGKSTKETTTDAKLERATFGGGCFWCLEAVFERVRGVKSVVSGYAGGNVPQPTYDAVCTGLTGHAEVVQIQYDPEVVTFDDLLKIFWACHDPTTLNSQGPDFGTQYRSIILYHDEDQKKAAQKSYQKLTADRVYASPIVTELVPLKRFYPAEYYHQDYFRRHKSDDYCQAIIAPKLRMLMKKLGSSAPASRSTR